MVSCSRSSSSDSVTIGETTRSVFYAPQYVAIAKGFFAKEGINIQLQTIPGGDKTMAALLSDAIDIALIGSETSFYVLQQYEENLIINFAQLTVTDGTFLISRRINDDFCWDHLKGSRFLGHRKGGMPYIVSQFILNKHGINSDQEIEIINNIHFSNMMSAFVSGVGDYAQLFEPDASILEEENIGKIVKSLGVESGSLPYTCFMTKKNVIAKNEQLIQKFSNALYKAQRWVSSHSPQQIARVIHPFFKEVSESVLTKSVARYQSQGSYATEPVISKKQWSNFIMMMQNSGELRSDLPLDTVLDNRFAIKAVKSVIEKDKRKE